MDEEVNSELQKLNKLLQTPEQIISPYYKLQYFDMTNIEMNFFDLVDCIAKIDWLVKEEQLRGNEVVIDVSVGNKLAVIALYLVGQLNKCELSYHTSSKTLANERLKGKITHIDVADAMESRVKLPSLPITSVKLPYSLLFAIDKSRDNITLTEITERMYYKKDLKTIPQENNPEFVKKTKSMAMGVSRQLNKLQDYGYITRDKGKKSAPIRITSQGKQIMDLQFSPSFNPSIAILHKLYHFMQKIYGNFSMKTFYQRFYLQKFVYLGTRYEFDFGQPFIFNLYLKGPYSPKLSSQGFLLEKLLDHDKLIKQQEQNFTSHELKVMENILQLKQQINEIHSSPDLLELLVTMDYLIREELKEEGGTKREAELTSIIEQRKRKKYPLYQKYKPKLIDLLEQEFDLDREELKY